MSGVYCYAIADRHGKAKLLEMLPFADRADINDFSHYNSPYLPNYIHPALLGIPELDSDSNPSGDEGGTQDVDDEVVGEGDNENEDDIIHDVVMPRRNIQSAVDDSTVNDLVIGGSETPPVAITTKEDFHLDGPSQKVVVSETAVGELVVIEPEVEDHGIARAIVSRRHSSPIVIDEFGSNRNVVDRSDLHLSAEDFHDVDPLPSLTSGTHYTITKHGKKKPHTVATASSFFLPYFVIVLSSCRNPSSSSSSSSVAKCSFRHINPRFPRH